MLFFGLWIPWSLFQPNVHYQVWNFSFGKGINSVMEVMVGIFMNSLDTIASVGISCLTVYCIMHNPVLNKTMFFPSSVFCIAFTKTKLDSRQCWLISLIVNSLRPTFKESGVFSNTVLPYSYSPIKSDNYRLYCFLCSGTSLNNTQWKVSCTWYHILWEHHCSPT